MPKISLLAAAFAGLLSLGAASTSFGQNLIQNGNFSTLTNMDGTTPNTAGGQLGWNVQATGWSTSGYNFVFPNPNTGTGTVTGSGGDIRLWASALPPLGGNVVAADGAYEVGPLSQTVGGMTVGHDYAVSFYWAGAQQRGYDGVTTESWSVALGGAGFTPNPDGKGESGTLAGAQTTAPVTNANHGFTGWTQQTFTFTATSSSEVLYFFANGTPSGQPPFSLLGNVSLTAVPEASTWWTILFTMAIMVGTAVWRRTRGTALAMP